MSVVVSLLPDIALILLGVLIARLLVPSIWAGIDRLCYYVLYPGLIFHAAASRPVAFSEALVLGASVVAIMSSGLVLGLMTRPLKHSSDVDFGGAVQNAYRFNAAFAFVAVGVLPIEAISVLAIIVGCAIPLANVYAVIGLTRGANVSLRKILKELATNPFLLASVGGLSFALSGSTLPPFLEAFSGRLAEAALPLVLLSMGAALTGAQLWPLDRQAFVIHAIRLWILPLGVLAAAWLFDLRGIPIATVLLFAAMPTASAAHILASRYGADRSAVALIVTQSTLLGVLMLPLWAWVAVQLLA